MTTTYETDKDQKWAIVRIAKEMGATCHVDLDNPHLLVVLWNEIPYYIRQDRRGKYEAQIKFPRDHARQQVECGLDEEGRYINYRFMGMLNGVGFNATSDSTIKRGLTRMREYGEERYPNILRQLNRWNSSLENSKSRLSSLAEAIGYTAEIKVQQDRFCPNSWNTAGGCGDYIQEVRCGNTVDLHLTSLPDKLAIQVLGVIREYAEGRAK